MLCHTFSLGSRLLVSLLQTEALSNAQAQFLIERPTAGWPCGVHPSLQRFTSCIRNGILNDFSGSGLSVPHSELARYFQLLPSRGMVASDRVSVFLLTGLREPVERYVSEFMNHFSGWTHANDGSVFVVFWFHLTFSKDNC
eukprot:m.335031 g.335031  ORF g.335031 m.335031 type:complete len:141 (+) comp55676_c0_seq16:338-760(+)